VVDTRAEYDGLVRLFLPIAVGVFVVVALVLAFCLVRYRARPGREPSARKEAPRVELAYIALLFVAIVVLVVPTFRTESREDALAASPALRVHVVAAQWNWRFAWAGRTSVQGASGIGTPLVVPAGRTIQFDATSIDVVHDFWVPDLRFQRQVYPAHTEHFDLVFPHPGRYEGVCAVFCGLYHQNMHFVVQAVSPGAFRAMLRAPRPAHGAASA
jgi:cytochrome c oxidase subunit 2